MFSPVKLYVVFIDWLAKLVLFVLCPVQSTLVWKGQGGYCDECGWPSSRLTNNICAHCAEELREFE